MTVQTLQLLLRSLAAVSRSAGGPGVGDDIERVAARLTTFGDWEFDTLAGFLERCEKHLTDGTVVPPADFDLSPLEQHLQRLSQLRRDAGDVEDRLAQEQRALLGQIGALAKSVGLSGTLKVDMKWAKAQAIAAAAAGFDRAIRGLAERVSVAADLDSDGVRQEAERLDAAIKAEHWKLLGDKFGLPTAKRGGNSVSTIIARLRGIELPKKGKSKAAPPLDAERVRLHADRLRGLLARALHETEIPTPEIDAEIAALDTLSKDELIAATTEAGLERPGKSKKDVLAKVRKRLDAGRRIQAQTAQ